MKHATETPASPVRPCVAVRHPSGVGEYFIDARGRAFNAASERLPEFDGPPMSPCPTCGREVKPCG